MIPDQPGKPPQRRVTDDDDSHAIEDLVAWRLAQLEAQAVSNRDRISTISTTLAQLPQAYVPRSEQESRSRWRLNAFVSAATVLNAGLFAVNILTTAHR